MGTLFVISSRLVTLYGWWTEREGFRQSRSKVMYSSQTSLWFLWSSSGTSRARRSAHCQSPILRRCWAQFQSRFRPRPWCQCWDRAVWTAFPGYLRAERTRHFLAFPHKRRAIVRGPQWLLRCRRYPFHWSLIPCWNQSGGFGPMWVWMRWVRYWRSFCLR